jgi:tetratricopeptide (TPR) repeat protein
MRRVPLLLAAAGLMAGAAWLGWRSAGGAAPLDGRPADASRPEIPATLRTANGQSARRDMGAAIAKASRRDASPTTLLAAALVTKDDGWLRRAAELHPGDPDVLLALVRAAKTPEERMAAIKAFRSADPDNALGPYLEAIEAVRAGDPAGAAASLVDASMAAELRRGEVSLLLEVDAMLRESGADSAEAYISALGMVPASSGMELSQLGKGLGELQRIFIQLGEWDEADFLLEETLRLGGDLREGGLMIDNVAGIAIERSLLADLDPDTVINWDGERVRDRMTELAVQTDYIAGLSEGQTLLERLREMTEEEWARFREVLREQGELEALREIWVK